MFYDLNVPWTANAQELQRKIAFLAELGYNVLALSHTYNGKLPADLTSPIPSHLPFSVPAGVQILRRTTLVLTDSAQNFRISDLQSHSDLLALRPTDEKTFQSACQTLDCDIVSVDLTQRHFFRFKHSTLSAAFHRGVKIELSYSPGLVSSDPVARRNLIQNATAIIRATRGRGLVISSEARDALGCRGPADVVNLACIWGLGSEVGHEAVSKEARRCVGAARLKRSSYRGAVDVVYGGVKPDKSEKGRKEQGQQVGGNKRKAEDDDGLSKRQRKKLAHEARMKAAAEAKAKDAEANTKGEGMDGVVPNKSASTEARKTA